jgi:tRNA uridine 5-carboxymethylaminomethyl modification enzyme
VREIDALGGEMGRVTDRTFIQIRMLNTGKGPAVQALRAQSDKRAYGLAMKQSLERQPGLSIKQAMAEDLGRCGDQSDGGRLWVRTATGQRFRAKTVILTTGTSLAGRLIVGDLQYEGGRAGEAAATKLSQSLRALGLRLGRLKTGTPPRVDAKTIDFERTETQPGSPRPLSFSFEPPAQPPYLPPPNPVYPGSRQGAGDPSCPAISSIPIPARTT